MCDALASLLLGTLATAIHEDIKLPLFTYVYLNIVAPGKPLSVANLVHSFKSYTY